MPELPEVETAQRVLEPVLKGRTVDTVEIEKPRTLRRPKDPEAFAKALKRQSIKGVRRHGKLLIFDLGADLFLVFHHKLRARLGFTDDPRPTQGLRIYFDKGPALDFHSMTFSEFHLVTERELLQMCPAPDALDKSFNQAKLGELLAVKSSLKPRLMDQAVLQGIGNTYADELLWEAELSPFRASQSLSESEVDRLHTAMRATLTRAIEARGEASYHIPDGKRGGYHPRIHGRKGEPCPRCNMPLEMERKGRATTFCPQCQPFISS